MVQISGTYTLRAPREAVWPRVVDPNSLLELIPGCDELVQVSEDEYRGEISLRLPAVSGVFRTQVLMLEQVAPSHCRFQGDISGPTGRVTGTAAFHLQDVEDGTLLAYEAQGLVTGGLSRMPERFVQGVVKTLLHQGLGKLNKNLQQAKT